MRRTGIDVQLGRHAGVTQAGRVVDVLVTESIQGAHADKGARQSLELGRARGRRIGRHPVPAESTEIAIPAVTIRFRRPHRIAPP